MYSYATIGLSPAIDVTLTLDVLPAAGTVTRCSSENTVPGGKSFNVARLLAAHGRDVAAAAIVGSDATDTYQRECRASGITPAFLTVDHPTRHNLTLLAPDGESKINHPAFPDLTPSPELLDALLTPILTCDVVLLTGSMPPQFGTDTVTHIVNCLKKAGGTVVADTSGPALRAAADAGADIISPNRAEFLELTGDSVIVPADLTSWLSDSLCTTLILSDGPRGAWFANDDQLLHVPSPDVQVRDTTGAGDALLAQFLADFFPTRHLTPAIAARAVAAGAAACEHPGPHCPDPARIDQLVTQSRHH